MKTVGLVPYKNVYYGTVAKDREGPTKRVCPRFYMANHHTPRRTVSTIFYYTKCVFMGVKWNYSLAQNSPNGRRMAGVL